MDRRLEGDQKVKGQNGACGPLALAGAAWFGWAMMLAACSNQTAPVSETKLEGWPPSGSVEMHEVREAYMASGSAGSGTLYYQGGVYPFTVGGVGVGGIGASTIQGKGDVYNLTSVAQFPGTYRVVPVRSHAECASRKESHAGVGAFVSGASAGRWSVADARAQGAASCLLGGGIIAVPGKAALCAFGTRRIYCAACRPARSSPSTSA
jgi:hypothetical protein